jgi:hypothetical protein
MLYLKLSLQIIGIFAVASALAFAFGFHTLFLHTAFEAVYWGGYYLASLMVGLFFINKVVDIKPIDIVKG